MPDIGVPELLIIAVIVVLLFGPGKAADLGGSLGKSIREFRRESNAPHDGSNVAAQPKLEEQHMLSVAPTSDERGSSAAQSSSAHFCVECGSGLGDGQKFCSNCGTQVAALAQ